MNNPLHQVGQTPHAETSPSPDDQSGDAGNAARQQNQTDEAGKPPSPPVKKSIRELQPGEPPPESSAGS